MFGKDIDLSNEMNEGIERWDDEEIYFQLLELLGVLNSTSKCNFLFPKEYIIGCFKSKTFPWPII
jgi:hypothetical protein